MSVTQYVCYTLSVRALKTTKWFSVLVVSFFVVAPFRYDFPLLREQQKQQQHHFRQFSALETMCIVCMECIEHTFACSTYWNGDGNFLPVCVHSMMVRAIVASTAKTILIIHSSECCCCWSTNAIAWHIVANEASDLSAKGLQ